MINLVIVGKIDGRFIMKKWEILTRDPWLEPYRNAIDGRMNRFEHAKKRLLQPNQTLSDFANGKRFFGFNQEGDHWLFREWAPNAEKVALIGDFNQWNDNTHVLEQLSGGQWVLSVAGELPELSKVKLRIWANGQVFDRIPSYIEYAVQAKDVPNFDGVIWQSHYKWQNQAPDRPVDPLIYETHIGISSEAGKINSYREFARDVLPLIVADGYNTIQIMAIMEHPLYASFGYQVSNFFAPSSRFGTPDDLKALIDSAHGLGLTVLLDVVHSHAVSNIGEGLNQFDGSDDQYFHAGNLGNHPTWGTKLFNYGKTEVIHFLLSNLKYWLDEFHFDGFRFDGVTSMLYHHHGLGVAFDNYQKYFDSATDLDAVTYLQLATALIHEVNPEAIIISEDMSAMPGMALPISEGGIGFDYRLSMGVPDYWIKLLKNVRDEDWNLHQLWHELTTRRPGEKNIGYVESHDQALVGDKTIMFRLADAEMYTHMSIDSQSLIIDRAIALHKLIRLITFSLAGEGYLNFMGNEFGHPEWLDFPREGNHDSYHYARRQWHLATQKDLKYQFLLAFDQAMIKLDQNHHFLAESTIERYIQETEKLLAYQKGHLLFVFNFHPTASGQLSLIILKQPKFILDSDDGKFGGFGPRNHFDYSSADKTVNFYLEPRTVMVVEV